MESIKSIVKICNVSVVVYNVLVLALLVAMWFTDPEQGGMLFAFFLFSTIAYDVYYWMKYSMVMWLVGKNKVRKWWLLLGALFPFVPTSIIALLVFDFLRKLLIF